MELTNKSFLLFLFQGKITAKLYHKSLCKTQGMTVIQAK